MGLTLVPQNTLSIGTEGQPESFLPNQIQTDSEETVSKLIFRSLFKYEEGELVNDLVDGWKMAENKKEYTIKIKENAYWQDGTSITTNDIIYSVTLRKNLRDELSIEKLGPFEIRIILSTENAILPTLLTFGLEPEHIRNNSKLQPIGASSYHIARILKERNKIQGVILQSTLKNKSYSRLIINFYENQHQLLTAYKLGEINMFASNTQYTLPSTSVKNITYFGRYYSLVFNTQKEKLEDPDIKKNLKDALNISSLLEANYYTNAIIAQGPLSQTFASKQIFTATGEEGEVTITPQQRILLGKLGVVLPNNPDGQQIENFLKEEWGKNLGIEVKITYQEPEELIKTAKGGEFEVLFVGHEVSPDPDRYIFWHSTQIKGGLNFAKFEDPRADKALEEGRKVWTHEERISHYSIFQDVIDTKVPAVFLYHPGDYLYISDKKPLSLPQKLYYPSDIVKNL